MQRIIRLFLPCRVYNLKGPPVTLVDIKRIHRTIIATQKHEIHRAGFGMVKLGCHSRAVAVTLVPLISFVWIQVVPLLILELRKLKPDQLNVLQSPPRAKRELGLLIGCSLQCTRIASFFLHLVTGAQVWTIQRAFQERIRLRISC